MDLKKINEEYRNLDYIANDVFNSLFKLPDEYAYKIGHFNYRYYKEDNKYELAYYPIPVISITNLCDIEIDFNQIRFVTKMKAYNAVLYDFQDLSSYEFDLYSLDNQGVKLYESCNPSDNLGFKIRNNNIKEVGITFYFDKYNLPDIVEFVSFLDNQGFYY